MPFGHWEPGDPIERADGATDHLADDDLSAATSVDHMWAEFDATTFGSAPPDPVRVLPGPPPLRAPARPPAQLPRSGLTPRTILTLVLVVAVALGSVAYRLIGPMTGTADLGPDRSALVLPANGAERLPTFVTTRANPRPGFEEAIAPLGSPPAIAPSSTEYTFETMQTSADGRSTFVAWSPCRPIHVVVNSRGAPQGFVAAVRAALGATSAATGLVFVDDGATDEQPTARRAAFQPGRYGDRWAPVLIAFAGPDIVTATSEDAVGEASVVHVADPRTGSDSYVSGRVYLSTDLLRMRDHDRVPAYVPTLRHELGHLVGLGHVDDPHQLMFPTLGAPVTFQDGDLAGLAQLGRGACAPWL
jgi:matrixin